MQRFLQSFYGYSMTGSTEEQRVPLQHGEGSNFKSTMVETCCYVLGDYAKGIPVAALMESNFKSGNEPSPALARLPGVRLVRAAEPKQRAQLDESLIKQLTGGEEITARRLHKDFFDFKPEFKVILSFNRRPKIRGTDHGIWRRLLVVPFPISIKEEDADKTMLEKLKHEGPAILNWMLDGYRVWRDHGLVVPKAIKDATTAYRAESDPIFQFLDSACVITGKEEQTATAADLWRAYQAWCPRNGKVPISNTWFGGLITERKGVSKRTVKTVCYFGIAVVDRSLLDDPPAEQSGEDPPPHDEAM